MIEEDTINGLTPLAIKIGISVNLLKGRIMYGARNRRSCQTVSESIMTIKNRNISIAPIGDANLNVPISNFGALRNTGRRVKLVEFLSFAVIESVGFRMLF